MVPVVGRGPDPRWMSDGTATIARVSEHVLEGLDPEQRLVAEALRGPVVVLAGAGTGKTRAITHRIAHACLTGTHAASTGLAVTFTNRAAGEMRQRLANLGVPGVAVRTFHAAALSQLRYFWPSAVGGPFPELVSSKAKLVARACREVGLPTGPAFVRDLSSEFEWAASSLVSPAEYPELALRSGRTPPGTGADQLDGAAVGRSMAAYQQVKAAANVIDFEDVLMSMVAIVGERPDIADEIRKRYRWFTVDEYQDITPVQARLLEGWLGDRDDVCVVGDTSQTIYSFAGASADSLEAFARRWPQATEIRLDRCYRCTPQVVAAANALISSARLGSPVRLRSQRPAGPVPDLVTCADDADEAANVAGRIADLARSGMPYREMAVLMRTNAASGPIEAALAEAGLPYVMRGAERFFDRPEVREAVARLRGQASTSRRDGASPVGPAPTATPGPPTLPTPGTGLGEEVAAVLAGMGWRPSGPEGSGAARERWESLAALVALGEELAAAGAETLGEVVLELERRAAIAHAPTADGVTLATLHSAKGLEWSAVFIVGCAEGTLPISYADTPERVEEERRLLYVGLTRARDRLTVSWALGRAGSGRHREPSRFLAEIRSVGGTTSATTQSGLVRQGKSRATKDRRRKPPGRCRVCHAALVTAPERTLGRCRACPGNPDEDLAQRLRDWRLAKAREQDVPAFVVFTDVTLTALAERRPRDEDELLDVPGIGPAKAERYGPALLELVRAGASSVP